VPDDIKNSDEGVKKNYMLNFKILAAYHNNPI